MTDQLQAIKARYQALKKQLADTPPDAQRPLLREYSNLEKTMRLIARYEQNQAAQESNKALLQETTDEALTALAQEERLALEQEHHQLTTQLQALLQPQDPHGNKNAILEIRAGTGGDEATHWASDLFRMYERFAERKKWRLEVLSFTEVEGGGHKEIICNILGHQAYGTLRYESGVHRVQRVPDTEKQGRIHTSSASVVVLPEVDDVAVHLDMNDIKKETFCSSGPGGQSVNTTRSAVRLTHLPTGTRAAYQGSRSQIENFKRALIHLRARLYDNAVASQKQQISQKRKTIIGTGDRSAKIRTYNYPRDQVTDHRIRYTARNLTNLLNGHLDHLLQALRQADTT